MALKSRIIGSRVGPNGARKWSMLEILSGPIWLGLFLIRHITAFTIRAITSRVRNIYTLNSNWPDRYSTKPVKNWLEWWTIALRSSSVAIPFNLLQNQLPQITKHLIVNCNGKSTAHKPINSLFTTTAHNQITINNRHILLF